MAWCLTCWCCPLSAFSGVLVTLPAGLKIGYALFPLLIAPYGNKGFGPVWGIALYTMLRLLFWFLHVSPFLFHAASAPLCPPLLSLGASPFLLPRLLLSMLFWFSLR